MKRFVGIVVDGWCSLYLHGCQFGSGRHQSQARSTLLRRSSLLESSAKCTGAATGTTITAGGAMVIAIVGNDARAHTAPRLRTFTRMVITGMTQIEGGKPHAS